MCQGLEAYPAAATAAAAATAHGSPVRPRSTDATGGGGGFKRRESAALPPPSDRPPDSRAGLEKGFPSHLTHQSVTPDSLRWRTGGARGEQRNREQVKHKGGGRASGEGEKKATVISLCKHQHQDLHHAVCVLAFFLLF